MSFMELRITAFKGSPWQAGNTHEAVIDVRNANPDKLLGAHLVWRTETGRVIRGKIIKRHGHLTSSKLLARFHRGLPGQAIGTCVEVRERAAKAEKHAARVTASVPRSHAKAVAARPSAKAPGKSGATKAGTPSSAKTGSKHAPKVKK